MAGEAQAKIYRVAVADDITGILEVFAEVAPEVPTAVRPQTKRYVEGWVQTGESWVAVNAVGKIIGYALAEGTADTISLVYLGVAKEARGQHTSTELVDKLKQRGATVVADVMSDNKSSMVERFERFGFIKIPDVAEGKTKLRWTKPAAATPPPAAADG